MKSRIYGDKISIDPNQVNQFFEKRFYKDNPLASVMVRPGPMMASPKSEMPMKLPLLKTFYRTGSTYGCWT